MVKTRFVTFTILFVAFTGTSLFGMQVLKVGGKAGNLLIVSHGKTPWDLDQRACVVDGREKVACGKVVKITDRAAIIKVGKMKRDIYEGDTVKRVRKKRRKKKAAAPALLEPEEPPPLDEPPAGTKAFAASDPYRTLPKHHKFLLTVGGNIGFDHLIPFLHFQMMVTDHISLGVLPFYPNTTQSQTGAPRPHKARAKKRVHP